MLKWPISANAISFDKKDKQWKEGFTWTNSRVVPGWKVFWAHLGPGLLFLGFLPQIVAYWLMIPRELTPEEMRIKRLEQTHRSGES